MTPPYPLQQAEQRSPVSLQRLFFINSGHTSAVQTVRISKKKLNTGALQFQYERLLFLWKIYNSNQLIGGHAHYCPRQRCAMHADTHKANKSAIECIP